MILECESVKGATVGVVGSVKSDNCLGDDNRNYKFSLSGVTLGLELIVDGNALIVCGGGDKTSTNVGARVSSSVILGVGTGLAIGSARVCSIGFADVGAGVSVSPGTSILKIKEIKAGQVDQPQSSLNELN